MAGAIDRIFHPAIERVARTRYHPAREMVDELHQRYRPGNADELIKLIVKRYTRELAAVSALAGGAAAIPGAGTGTALMTSTADLAYSITKMGEMILAIGIAAGHDAQSLEQRRSWVVSVLTMANGASAGVEGLADDPRFSTNPARAKNRDALHARLAPVMAGRTTAEWVEGLSGIAVPCGPVNALDRVFADAQVRARGMRIEMPHPKAGSGTVPLLGNPIRMSATPVRYERPPPTLGQHTAEVLGEVLGLDGAALDDLRARGIIG